MNYLNDSLSQLIWHLPANITILAQNTNVDMVAEIVKTWNHFVQTGQIWALLIGLVVGYLLRNLTTYG
jgi:hypothetical protein